MNNVVMQYGLMMRIGNTIQSLFQKRKTTTVITVSRLYRSIHKLPLPIFIDCLIDKDYTKLIIEGNATNEELEECFSSLYMQYVESAGGREAIKKLESTQTVALMQMRDRKSVV